MRLPVVCCCLLQALAGFTQTPAIYDVVIHEVMPKPTPVAGLPPYEYIELRNISTAPVQLKDWRIAINKREALLPAYLLQPDSLLVLCAPAAVNSYNIPNIRGIDRFPAIADDSALIVLYDAFRRVIHAVDYHQGWYVGGKGIRGGISLEMINTAFPCSGKMNWAPSTALSGGTPGWPNAVGAGTIDPGKPDLLFASLTDSLHVLLQFSKTLDSALAADPARYQCSGGIKVNACRVIPPLFNNVELRLSAPLQPTAVYTIQTNGVADCNGEVSGIYNSITLGLPQFPLPGEVLISEVLFYPPPGIPEFIELYNASRKVIALNELRLCARKADGRFEVFKKIMNAGRLLMPGQLLAITTNTALLCGYYHCKAPENIQETGSLPSMPMAAGRIVLLRADSTVIDELPYTDGQHFPLASQLKGISLERLDYHLPAADGSNWQSAAATAGYATPGSPNSQRRANAGDSLNIALLPEVFSPDNDGTDDQVQLSWQLPGPGFVGNVIIYDLQGKPVRYLARNVLLGNSGYLSWDGIGENAVVLPPGIYIFFIEIFNPRGFVKHWKRTVVMARKLN
ncbi:lamin tail domain-containing protein [Chitinophaga arvensicola]|uniref:Lamin Tail Domain n=1 Tax=Chitinophaga arvensicola TaxID=29529 RepID=A0A1I0PUZ4_9BACT|nr:lamin tail domain-containing protein [Chitinophaga arvensicola]SEW18048.1 Lamin Tail Domain [Chitinophaga arvensicola]